jgi:hypothetical protein
MTADTRFGREKVLGGQRLELPVMNKLDKAPGKRPIL